MVVTSRIRHHSLQLKVLMEPSGIPYKGKGWRALFGVSHTDLGRENEENIGLRCHGEPDWLGSMSSGRTRKGRSGPG
jgi:hypothetical protein